MALAHSAVSRALPTVSTALKPRSTQQSYSRRTVFEAVRSCSRLTRRSTPETSTRRPRCAANTSTAAAIRSLELAPVSTTMPSAAGGSGCGVDCCTRAAKAIRPDAQISASTRKAASDFIWGAASLHVPDQPDGGDLRGDGGDQGGQQRAGDHRQDIAPGQRYGGSQALAAAGQPQARAQDAGRHGSDQAGQARDAREAELEQ